MDEIDSIARTSPEDAALRLLKLVDEFIAESHQQRGIAVTLDSSLERDLGLDSLARVELLLRAGHEFGVILPSQALVTVETPRSHRRAVE